MVKDSVNGEDSIIKDAIAVFTDPVYAHTHGGIMKINKKDN